jgi:hypothetical protein
MRPVVGNSRDGQVVAAGAGVGGGGANPSLASERMEIAGLACGALPRGTVAAGSQADRAKPQACRTEPRAQFLRTFM